MKKSIFSLGILLIGVLSFYSCNDEEETNRYPIVYDQFFSINENSPNGTEVGTVIATIGNNIGLKYYLLSEDVENPFSIDQESGLIFVNDSALIDYEKNISFVLIVKVTNSQNEDLFSTAIIVVSLNDEEETNLYPIVYDQFFSINENSPNGTEVGTVVATIGNNIGLKYYLLSEDIENTFSIDQESGLILVNDSALIDYEKNISFVLIVKVTNSQNEDLFSTAIIVLSVIDVDEIPIDGLLLFYTFNGTFNDIGPYAFHGVGTASFTTDRNGNPNSAASFNGVDQYVDLPSNSILKPQLPVSFSFWIKFNNIAPESTVIVTNDFATNISSGVWMNLSSSGYLTISYADALGSFSIDRRRTKIGTTQIQAGIWYHIVGIANGPLDMKMYINGTDDGGEYSGYGQELGYTNAQGSIGRKHANFNADPYYLNGTIDDFGYWNRALTEDEVQILFQLGNIQGK